MGYVMPKLCPLCETAISKAAKRCPSCAREKKQYMPTQEQIAKECEQIRAEREKRGGGSEMSVREPKVHRFLKQ